MAKQKRKKRRNVKPVREVIKLLKAAYKEINNAISDLDSCSMQLDDAKEVANEASREAEGIAEALRERIDELEYGARAKHKKNR